MQLRLSELNKLKAHINYEKEYMPAVTPETISKWTEVLELLIIFIERDVIKDGQIIKINPRNPFHWFALAKLGAELLRLIINIIKKL